MQHPLSNSLRMHKAPLYFAGIGQERDLKKFRPAPYVSIIAGRGLVFLWFFLGGAGHFLFTDNFASVVPPYIPYPRHVVLVTGVSEIVGALALFSKRLRPWSGLALMAFTICVTPVHIEMLKHAERYQSIGAPLLWARLLFQPILIWIIWMVTKPPQRRYASNWSSKR